MSDEHQPSKTYTNAFSRLATSASVDKLVRGLFIACAVLFVIDIFVSKHGPFSIEYWLGFYGLFGLLAGLLIAGAAVILRGLLARDEDYYDE